MEHKPLQKNPNYNVQDFSQVVVNGGKVNYFFSLNSTKLQGISEAKPDFKY
jgi:hypothetical protein